MARQGRDPHNQLPDNELNGNGSDRATRPDTAPATQATDSTPNAASKNGRILPIDQLASLQIARVVEVEADPDDEARLKALGICAGRRVQLVSRGDPLILRVLGTRIGLSAQLAAGVRVEPCGICGD